MAKLVNNGAGTTFSTATNWDTVSNTNTLHASSNLTINSGTYNSIVFTAPNTTNNSTGVLVYITAVGTAGTITAHLEENSAGWVSKANSGAINITTLKPFTWYYFRWSTPYTYAATTAGYYRCRLTTASTSGTTSVAYDASGTLGAAVAFSYFHTDNRNATPAVGTDDIFVCGANGTAASIIVDGTAGGCGTAAQQTIPITTINGSTPQRLEARVLTNAVNICNAGTLVWDNAASSTLTVRGNFNIYPGGTWEMDGSADQTKLLKLVLDMTSCTTTTGGYGINKAQTGIANLQGAPKSSTSLWKTTIASGIGTAADPVIMTDSVDWVVGDEICIPTSSNRATNYQETEYRYIITKNSATSYVWSATLGGLESGITAAYHTLVTYALNTTRNVLITTSNSSTGNIGMWYCSHNITDTTTEDLDWVRWENVGSVNSTSAGGTLAAAYKYGLTFGINADAIFEANYFVVKNPIYQALNNQGNTIPGSSATGWIVYNSAWYGGPGVFAPGGKEQTFNDIWCIDLQGGPWYCYSQSSTMRRCFVIGCNKQQGFNRGGFVDFNGANNTYYNCEAHATRKAGFTSWGTFFNKYIDCVAGTKGANEYNIIGNASGTATGFAYFHNALFDRFISDKATATDDIGFTPYMLEGSKIAFNQHQNVEGANHWFLRNGYARMTTTNARTASSKCVEITPNNTTTGFTYSFLVLARAGTAVQALGFVKKHTVDVASVATVSLFLPGSVTADYVQTMPDDDSWNPFVVYGNYTGTTDQFARVEINIKATSGLFLVDDIFNGTNNITALDASFEGQPSPVMFEQLGDAAAVWAIPTAILTTTGTTGKKLVDDLTTGKFIALK